MRLKPLIVCCLWLVLFAVPTSAQGNPPPDWIELQDTTTPDGTLHVYTLYQPVGCSTVGSAIFVEATTERLFTVCTNYDAIDFAGWLDTERLLIQQSYSIEGIGPIEEWAILDTSTLELISLGVGIENAALTDNMNQLIHVIQRNQRPQELFDCALEIVDLQTLEHSEIETTTCLYEPQITITEDQQHLFYVHYALDEQRVAAARYPTVSLRQLDLSTREVTQLPITGRAVQLLDVSEDGGLLSLLVDQDDETVNNPTWGVGGVVTFENPLWLVYDTQNHQVVYERPMLEHPESDSYQNGGFTGDIGRVEFEWTAEGWRTLFVTNTDDQSPVLIESDAEGIQEVVLSDLLGVEYRLFLASFTHFH